MALGKAFIEVHADTKPFAQELGKELGRILKAVENGPARKAGEALGKDLGQGASDGFEKSFKPSGGSGGGTSGGKSKLSEWMSRFGDPAEEGASFARRMAKGLIDTLDDGLSGLPAEIKAGLAVVLILLTPLLLSFGAAIATTIVTGLLAVGPAGLGVAIVSQLTVVQDAWTQTLADLQQIALHAAQPIVLPLLEALQTIRDGFLDLAPELRTFFAQAATAISPLVAHLMSFVTRALPILNSSLVKVATFADLLGQGLENIGLEVLRVFEKIANNDDAETALADTLELIRVLVALTGFWVDLFLDLYGAIRAGAEAMDIFNQGFLGTGTWEQGSMVMKKIITDTDRAAISMAGLKFQTEAEEKALSDLNSEIDKYTSEINDAWGANISFEESLDELTASLKENGRTTDINTEKGRNNQNAIKDSITSLLEQRAATIALTGDVEGANATFEENRLRLERAAIQGGITKQRYDELTAALLAVPAPVATGVTKDSISSLERALNLAQLLSGALNAAANAKIRASPSGNIGGGMQKYADGGIFNKPTVGMFGEAGEEVILPTTNPGRTAELISQSPMLSSMMSPNVSVYIGNQQIDAYIDERVARSQTATARSLSYGSRSI